MMSGVDVVQDSSSVRALSPVVYQRERLADVHNVAALLVAGVPLRIDLRQPAALRMTQKPAPFTALLLPDDEVDDPSFNHVLHRRWDRLAFTVRRRHGDVTLPEERYVLRTHLLAQSSARWCDADGAVAPMRCDGRQSGGAVWATPVCRFQNGCERRLYATHLGGASMVNAN